jgi:hypothetical protein
MILPSNPNNILGILGISLEIAGFAIGYFKDLVQVKSTGLEKFLTPSGSEEGLDKSADLVLITTSH